MSTVLDLLAGSPLLLLFVVAALGYVTGKLRVGGVGLGVAAVLFVGLGVGSLDARLKLPELVQTLGLVLFVYTVGLASGPGFFASLRRRGLALNGLVLALLVVAAVAALVVGRSFHLSAATTAGLFAGALTNTPSLAGVVETLGKSGAQGDALAAPVVAYSIAYPFGVLGILAAMIVVDRRRAEEAPPSVDPGRGALATRTVRIASPAAVGKPIAEAARGLHVVLGRVRHGSVTSVAKGDTVLEAGDVVTVVGDARSVDAAVASLGEDSPEHIELDRRELDFRRVFVSSPRVVGIPLRELRLPERYDAVVTRVRRGDVDMLAEDDVCLELGDRVRIVAPRQRLPEVTRLFGDSARALAEIDVITFGLGITLGLLLGAIPLPLGGGRHFTLGLAGGPLVVGLLLGRASRTGPLVWSMPLSANLTLRQLGLVLFLAGVGTRSGYAFVTTLRSGDGPLLFAAGALVTFLVALAAVALGRRALGLSTDPLLGILAGLQTQPAALAFALERASGDRPNVAYATVYPLATIAKIVLAQLIINFSG